LNAIAHGAQNAPEPGGTMIRRSAILRALGVLLLLDALPAHADDCEKLVASLVKLNHAPFRQGTTIDEASGPGKIGIATKKIFTGDALYELRDDKWKKTPATADSLDETLRNGRHNFQESCWIERTETLNGEDADVMSTHSESANSVANATVQTDTRYWISRKSNLPLKAEHTMSIVRSENDASILKYTTLYEYDNVQAPTQ
jgi:hypothetical protein